MDGGLFTSLVSSFRRWKERMYVHVCVCVCVYAESFPEKLFLCSILLPHNIVWYDSLRSGPWNNWINFLTGENWYPTSTILQSYWNWRSVLMVSETGADFDIKRCRFSRSLTDVGLFFVPAILSVPSSSPGSSSICMLLHSSTEWSPAGWGRPIKRPV